MSAKSGRKYSFGGPLSYNKQKFGKRSEGWSIYGSYWTHTTASGDLYLKIFASLKGPVKLEPQRSHQATLMLGSKALKSTEGISYGQHSQKGGKQGKAFFFSWHEHQEVNEVHKRQLGRIDESTSNWLPTEPAFLHNNEMMVESSRPFTYKSGKGLQLKVGLPYMAVYFEFYSHNKGAQHYGRSDIQRFVLNDSEGEESGPDYASNRKYQQEKPQEIIEIQQSIEEPDQLEFMQRPSATGFVSLALIISIALVSLLFLAFIAAIGYSLCKKKVPRKRQSSEKNQKKEKEKIKQFLGKVREEESGKRSKKVTLADKKCIQPDQIVIGSRQ